MSKRRIRMRGGANRTTYDEFGDLSGKIDASEFRYMLAEKYEEGKRRGTEQTERHMQEELDFYREGYEQQQTDLSAALVTLRDMGLAFTRADETIDTLRVQVQALSRVVDEYEQASRKTSDPREAVKRRVKHAKSNQKVKARRRGKRDRNTRSASKGTDETGGSGEVGETPREQASRASGLAHDANERITGCAVRIANQVQSINQRTGAQEQRRLQFAEDPRPRARQRRISDNVRQQLARHRRLLDRASRGD